jgi:DNA-binding MarR family transcriptional regulator
MPSNIALGDEFFQGFPGLTLRTWKPLYDGVIQYNVMEYRTQRATEARRERGAGTDYDLYEMISDHPGSSSYELAKLMGWTTGRTRSAIDRLERKGLIKVERAVRDGRSVLSVVPKPWQEFLTPEELEEFRQMEL